MKEEHQLGENSCPYSWLNEWLCEYVDGTMDPSLRRVFEKYVEANPDLKAHIERLRHTRELLCRCSQSPEQEVPDAVPEAVRARVREKVECDLLRTPHSLRDAVKERPVTAFVSSFMVALVVGLFAGATLFAPEVVSTPTTPTASTPSSWERPAQMYRRAPQSMRAQTTIPGDALWHAYPFSMEQSLGAPYTVDSSSGGVLWRVPVQP
jgi:anti-sigma factor RsiW